MTKFRGELKNTLYEIANNDVLVYHYLKWYEVNKEDEDTPNFEELLMGLCIAQSNYNKELQDQIVELLSIIE